MSELDDNGPVFEAKKLKAGDVIEYRTHSTFTYRVIANSGNEALLQRHGSSYNKDTKRVDHATLDKAKFIHVGRVPGFFKSIFMDTVSF